MLNKALGPVWHKKQKSQGIIPKGLRGIDRDATWGKSSYDGWVYGHGSFSLVTHNKPFLGMFKWIPNSAHEAWRMWIETEKLKGCVKKVFMDSKADSVDLFFRMKEQRNMLLVTVPRKRNSKIKSHRREKMIEILSRRNLREEYRNRSYIVEPMQGIVKEIFELERCWTRGNDNNRWMFAAMGVSIQMAQWDAVLNKCSPWAIKEMVLNQ